MNFLLKSVTGVLTILAAVILKNQAAPLTGAVPLTKPCGPDRPVLPLSDQLKSLITETNYAADMCRTLLNKLNGTALTVSEAHIAAGKDAQSEMKLPQRVSVIDTPVAVATGDRLVMNSAVLKLYYEDLSIYFMSMRRELAFMNGGKHTPEMERAHNAIKSVMCKVDGIFKIPDALNEPVGTTNSRVAGGSAANTDEKTQAKKIFAIVHGARVYLQDVALNLGAVANKA